MITRTWLLLIAGSVIAACAVSSDPGTGSKPASDSHGMVVGFVRDTAGRGVSNAKVCATALLNANGTPLILVNRATTKASGAYEIPFDFGVNVDVRAGLTVAATPSVASGLAPALRSGLTLLIAATPPPAETTHADVQVPKGAPYDGVFCAYGP